MNRFGEMETSVRKVYEKVVQEMPWSSQIQPLEDLLEDIRNDYTTVMVVGEFKHGKSTFVNALLGHDIMPRDITPTTAAVHAIFHSNHPGLQVVRHNGEVESQDATLHVLKRYTASADNRPEEIKYIKVFMDSPLLKEKVVLIDTPGVSDLSEQRAEVTHHFLPRADVVIFMGSMNTVMKKSEKEFIESRMKPLGLDHVLFVMNFMDQIEDEELDDLIEFSERRVQSVTGESHQIFPVSAKEALDARLNSQLDMLDASGIAAIEEEIHKRVAKGSRRHEKQKRFDLRFSGILSMISSEVATAEALTNESEEDVKGQLANVESWLRQQDQWHQSLEQYLLEREEEINFIVRKSFRFFSEKMKKDIEHRINVYHGADIKALVEYQIPSAIKSHFTHWVDQYSDHIKALFIKLANEVSTGLSRSFQRSVNLSLGVTEELRYDGMIPILEAKSGNANVKAGLLVGGVGSVALLLGGPFFLPVMGMAGLPLISQKIAEKQLASAKPDLIYAVDRQIDVLLDEFQAQLNRYIRSNVENIKDRSMNEFKALLKSYQAIVARELQEHESAMGTIDEKRKRLTSMKDFIILSQHGKEVEKV